MAGRRAWADGAVECSRLFKAPKVTFSLTLLPTRLAHTLRAWHTVSTAGRATKWRSRALAGAGVSHSSRGVRHAGRRRTVGLYTGHTDTRFVGLPLGLRPDLRARSRVLRRVVGAQPLLYWVSSNVSESTRSGTSSSSSSSSSSPPSPPSSPRY